MTAGWIPECGSYLSNKEEAVFRIFIEYPVSSRMEVSFERLLSNLVLRLLSQRSTVHIRRRRTGAIPRKEGS